MAPLQDLSRAITFAALDGSKPLSELLELEAPPFRQPNDILQQLNYIERYVRRDDLGVDGDTRCVAIESHYVDRDYIVDYSVLFSRNLQPPKNYCRRVHFFAADFESASQELRKIAKVLYDGGPKHEEMFRELCADFSRRFYLGFTIIRPLPGCPVGRTVLRHLQPKTTDNSQRVMTCTRRYRVNFSGVKLAITGLAFQQQDLGVSRCATVAVWCALHKLREREEIASFTPADITGFASKHRLPYGRSMPSEGLAVDQLCLAIESVGISPYLASVSSFERGRSLVYSATLSHMPCILVMELAVPQSGVWHAVTVAGMKLNPNLVSEYIGNKKEAGQDLAGYLEAIYVHDDRIGPYVSAKLKKENMQLRLTTTIEGRDAAKPEEWIVRYVLIPTHGKIRVSLNELRTIIEDWLTPEVQRVVAGSRDVPVEQLDVVRFKYWIELGQEYSSRVLRERLLGEDESLTFCQNAVLSRYVGVVRYSSDAFGEFDVLIDTTSPRPNYNWLGVVARKGEDDKGELRHLIAEYLAELCNCSSRYFS